MGKFSETTIVGTDAPVHSTFEELLKDVVNAHVPPVLPTLPTGEVLDDAYRIDEQIGQGGMGRVYRAHDIRLGRDVAIKVHVVLAVDGKQWSLREATALARLQHPNVVTVYEVGNWLGHPWVAMEFAPNGTVRTWLKEAPRPQAEILAMLVAAGRGLAAAHERGIVHRDFKPDNILVTASGTPRVCDFGLALELEQADGKATRVVMGTPAYMAPEQWDRAPVGTAADQFAFAISLWELLTGARPHPGNTEAELRAKWSAPPPPARSLPRHLETALRRALAVDPADRWPSMTPLLDALMRDPRRARRTIAIAATAGVLLAGGGALAATQLRSDAPLAAGPSCATATASFARAEELRHQIPARPDDRSLEVLDAWMQRWRTSRTQACEDTDLLRTQPVAVRELRELCLDQARAHVEATLVELGTAQDRVAFVEALPRLDRCDDVAQLRASTPLPADPAARAEIEAVSTEIAKARVLKNAGHDEQAHVMAEALFPRAQRTGHKSLIAESELLLAIVRITARKFDGVRALYEDAARNAAQAGDVTLEAEAWADLIDLLSARLEQPLEAEKMIPVLESAVLRAGNTGLTRGDFLAAIADVEMRQRHYTQSRDHFQEAVELYVKFGGPVSETARLLNRLAALSFVLDDLDYARTSVQRAAKLLTDTYGPKYRHIAVLRTTLGEVEHRAGNFVESRRLLEESLAMKLEASGPDSPTLVPTLNTLGDLLVDMNELDLAETHLARSHELALKKYGPAHAKTLETLREQAKLLIARKRWADAETLVTTVLAGQHELGPTPEVPYLELQLAEVYLHTQRLADARAAVKRAQESVGDEQYILAKSHEMLGRIELAAGKRAAAVTALGEALTMLTARRGPEHPETRAVRALVEPLR